ncbi:MAG: hypothetical protein LBL82_01260 [Oscillospiraceae bacterium]|nr:hypothetical protein [Oscillospiraceae bacterium]
MIEQDTIKLLRECDSGIKMGVKSIDDVVGRVRDENFRKSLLDCKREHERLADDVEDLLNKYHDEGRDPSVATSWMSKLMTNVKLAADDSDETVSDLMTDGCNMGVKSLSRYLNQYRAADEDSKNITKKLICLESDLSEEIRRYL